MHGDLRGATFDEAVQLLATDVPGQVVQREGGEGANTAAAPQVEYERLAYLDLMGFAQGSAELSEAHRSAISLMVVDNASEAHNTLQDDDQWWRCVTSIEGYCSPEGSEERNAALAEDRAREVATQVICGETQAQGLHQLAVPRGVDPAGAGAPEAEQPRYRHVRIGLQPAPTWCDVPEVSDMARMQRGCEDAFGAAIVIGEGMSGRMVDPSDEGAIAQAIIDLNPSRYPPLPNGFILGPAPSTAEMYDLIENDELANLMHLQALSIEYGDDIIAVASAHTGSGGASMLEQAYDTASGLQGIFDNLATTRPSEASELRRAEVRVLARVWHDYNRILALNGYGLREDMVLIDTEGRPVETATVSLTDFD